MGSMTNEGTKPKLVEGHLAEMGRIRPDPELPSAPMKRTSPLRSRHRQFPRGSNR